MIRVRALQPGLPAPPIDVEITAAHVLSDADTELYRPDANYTVVGTQDIEFANSFEAARFKPGDDVWLSGAASRVRVGRAMGATLRLTAPLPAALPIGATGVARLANAAAGGLTIRLIYQGGARVPAGALVAGSMLTIVQGATSDTQFVDSVQAEPFPPDPANPTADPITTYRVNLRAGLRAPFTLDPAGAQATVRSEEFNFTVTQGAASSTYANLSIDGAHRRFFPDVVNTPGGLVHVEFVEDPPPAAQPPANLPAPTGGPVQLQGGAVEDLNTIGDPDYIDALETLRRIDDVNMIAVPDSASAVVQQAIIAQCEQTADRVGVLDSRAGFPLFTAGATIGVDRQRADVDSTRGYAALYYPWIKVMPAGPGRPIPVPPSGHVCGLIARTDQTRGVFKAPANENLAGAVDIQSNAYMSDPEQGLLNLMGINVIRIPAGGGRPKVMGARTTATDLNWQYVNVRRLFLFVEESIQEGIKWAVFEPNDLGLWARLRRTIRAFLYQQWVNGALFGATADDAFYVRIDEALNPFSEQALGRLHIEIGIRPVYPAEFIIVRIGIWEGGSEVSEA
jgi:hypothetical protein